MPMPDYSDMVDELGPDSLAACSGSTSVPHAGVGGSAALVAASSATSKQQGGAAVLQDPISALDGRWCSGRLSAVPEGRGGDDCGSRRSSRRVPSILATTTRPTRRSGRPRWNSGCSKTGWVVAPHPRPRQQPETTATASGGIIDDAYRSSTASSMTRMTIKETAIAELAEKNVELQEENEYWQQRGQHWQQLYEAGQHDMAATTAKFDRATTELAEVTAKSVLMEQQHNAACAQTSAAKESAREWQQKCNLIQQQAESVKKQLAKEVAGAEEERRRHTAACAQASVANLSAREWQQKHSAAQQEISKLISVCKANEKAHQHLSKENKELQKKIKGLITTCMQNENLIRDLFEERDYLEKENKRLKRQRS